jgi:hypothetical protein
MPEPDELEKTFQRWKGKTPEEKQKAFAYLEGYQRRDLSWLNIIQTVDKCDLNTAKRTAQRMQRMSKPLRRRKQEQYIEAYYPEGRGERPARMTFTELVPRKEIPLEAREPELTELERLRIENAQLRKENKALQDTVRGINERLRLVEKELMKR